MRTVRAQLSVGLTTQLMLLLLLARIVGLSPAGWLAGTALGVATTALLARGLRSAGSPQLGPADRVTLARAVLVGGVTALIATSFTAGSPVGGSVGVIVTIAAVALALDAVDGRVARQTGTISTLGARFDMEVDAFLIFVLSVYVAREIGPWVLTIGLARYAFVAAGWACSWLRQPTPARYWCKVVAAIQGIVLTVVASGILSRAVDYVVLAGALALLAESFGRDAWWLARHRPAPVAPRRIGSPVLHG